MKGNLSLSVYLHNFKMTKDMLWKSCVTDVVFFTETQKRGDIQTIHFIQSSHTEMAYLIEND